MEKTARESKFSFSPIAFIHFVLFPRFLSWVHGVQCLLLRFWCLLYSRSNWDSNPNAGFELSSNEHREEKENQLLSVKDAETVMKRLGLFSDTESEDLGESFGLDEVSGLFDEKAPRLEEIKEAFNIFDQNRDGYVDENDLKRVLCALGFKEGLEDENCKKMIKYFDEDQDGRIVFQEFKKLLEDCFC